MTTYLSVCLQAVWRRCGAGHRDVELELCTVLGTRISNWSLDLEQCPIELDYVQARRLYDSGVECLTTNLRYLVWNWVDYLYGWGVGIFFWMHKSRWGGWRPTSPWACIFSKLGLRASLCVPSCTCLVWNEHYWFNNYPNMWADHSLRSNIDACALKVCLEILAEQLKHQENASHLVCIDHMFLSRLAFIYCFWSLFQNKCLKCFMYFDLP